MDRLDIDIDWGYWFDQWELMQNGYIPHRLYRFNLIYEMAGLAAMEKPRILDLGCGPYSLSFQALEVNPLVEITAVDFDLVLLTMGQKQTRFQTENIQPIHTDIRNADWWKEFPEMFDLVVSSTALHWMNQDDLKNVIKCSFEVLKPGGLFFNSDHIAADNPLHQAAYIKLLQNIQKKAFEHSTAMEWEAYWDSFKQALQIEDLSAYHSGEAAREFSDDGLPESVHINLLLQCGFEDITIHWRDLGEAVIGAKKGSRP